MDRADVARRLNVAEPDVVLVEDHEGGVLVTLRTGERKLLTESGWRTFKPGEPVEAPEKQDEASAPEPVTELEEPDGVEQVVQQRDERTTEVEVPDGTAREVLDWVGDDQDRAREALAAESRREVPRKSLVAELEKRAG